MSVATSTRTCARLEAVERALARVLRLVAVDGVRREAGLLQMLGDAVGDVLGAGEDDDALELVHRAADATSSARLSFCAMWITRWSILSAVLVGGETSTRSGWCSMSPTSLTTSSGMVAENSIDWRFFGSIDNDAAHVLDEAHVEHAVGFVDDQRRYAVETDMLLLDEVEQAARRGDEDVDALFHGVDLRVLVDAAKDDGMAQAEMAAIGPEAGVDLNRELARRREDQGARAAMVGADAVFGETLEQRQAERRGLAGAGLGDAQQVAAGQQRRDGADLDRRRRGVVLGRERAQKRLGKAEGCKSCIRHKNIP